MAVEAPEQLSGNPIRRVFSDIHQEVAAKSAFPPGPGDFSLARTFRFVRDPLPILLPAYQRYGPIFSMRLLHGRVVFMLGPEANHYVTVSHASNFHWREGSFGDLIPLLGDGLLTIDGDYHRRARRIMLPAFHRERIAAAGETMVQETLKALAGWQPGQVVDVYHWARELALRVAMRALFGLDPDDHGAGRRAAIDFERALSFYGTDFALRLVRGPKSPWRTMLNARATLDEIIYGEIAKRRRNPDPERQDVLSLLLEARDEDGEILSHREVRDQTMTLLFAGHDTTTSTVSFLFYELARHPAALRRLLDEQDEVLQGRAPTTAELTGGLPQLEMALDETLRLYPAAWVGPRKALETFEFGGCTVPAGSYVNYSSWASHRLPDVWAEPEAFVPERFAPEQKAKLPKGAYIPFGGGSRICIGMRFGQLEIKTIATLLLQRFRLELFPGRTMTVRQMPTLSPREPLEMIVRERGVPAGLA
ncbi:cytochrome P450 [Conexibacter sp. JD483]|uniref:cytochrome P450 n=1 Tax=unclassified Conexibacter TaxID=2627773 RepID=UPI002722BC19|nr:MULTISPECIES: cytochrome P450 [unclassified Conexibacter]MDO8185676.1 cytochrome P450 [Conexibacter sp. CPCC 205706]MDO8198849.1 cytochrome P450 [Conexibacter sp. CPCC 205762]MDR9372082.1 cytochrome P450 [Conexibacter sp. JD483]